MTIVGKKKNIRKIKRGKKEKPDLYFNADTQRAIEEYQKIYITSGSYASQLYTEVVHPSFNKLVENLINIHGFAGLHDTPEDLRADCITFLFESIHKFDGSRGTNAFSYFNIVAKHWLIIRSKKRMNKIKRNVSMDDIESLSPDDAESIEEFNLVPSQDDIVLKRDAPSGILEMLYKLKDKVKNPNEMLCMDSVISLFENIEELDFLNKSAILIYIREMSGLSPKQLTMALSSIKKYYRELKGEELNIPDS